MAAHRNTTQKLATEPHAQALCRLVGMTREAKPFASPCDRNLFVYRLLENVAFGYFSGEIDEQDPWYPLATALYEMGAQS